MVTAVSEKHSSANSNYTPLVVREFGWYLSLPLPLPLFLPPPSLLPPLSPSLPLPLSLPSPLSSYIHISFLLLSQVDYRERYSASNKIPRTFFRRELRATNSEIIVSRYIGKFRVCTIVLSATYMYKYF